MYAALRALDRRGELATGALDAMVEILFELQATRVPLAKLLRRAHAVGARFSPRDAFYVALAQRIGAELLTRDARLARASAGVIRARLV